MIFYLKTIIISRVIALFIITDLIIIKICDS
jgi:hypothetical protein